MSPNVGSEHRITQTLIIAVIIALVWLFNVKTQPAAEIHRVNFGNQVQLVNVIPAPENVVRGRNVEFVIRWWLLEPLPAGYSISYQLRNRQKTIALLDTNSIQATGQAYATIPTGGLVFDDRISLPIPANTAPGIYEIIAYLYPFEGYEINQGLGSPIYSLQRTLFTVNITP
jgi:hypothetical protein